MLIATEWNFTCVFPGTVRTWPLNFFRKGASVKFTLRRCALCEHLLVVTWVFGLQKDNSSEQESKVYVTNRCPLVTVCWCHCQYCKSSEFCILKTELVDIVYNVCFCHCVPFTLSWHVALYTVHVLWLTDCFWSVKIIRPSSDCVCTVQAHFTTAAPKTMSIHTFDYFTGHQHSLLCRVAY